MAESALTTVDAGATGSLVELPGGDLRLALGAQYRRETRLTHGDHDASELSYGFFFGFSDFSVERDVTSAHLELLWPLLHGVELQTAGRVEHHQDVATSVSPSAGLVLTPAELAGRERAAPALRDLRLRGQITRAFRSPSLYETAPGFSTSIAVFDEGGIDMPGAVLAHGNPDLEPEKALVVTGGVEWSPVKQLGLSAEYWNYDYEDAVAPESAEQIHRNDASDPRVRRDSAGRLIGVDVRVQNAGAVLTDGLDLGAQLALELSSRSRLSLGAQLSYTLRYELAREQVALFTLEDGREVPTADCDGERCDIAGNRNYANFANPLPRVRLNVPVLFEHDGHAIALTGHFVGPLQDDENPDPETGELAEVDPFLTLDLQYAYTIEGFIGEATTLRVGMVNLLDADPPHAGTTWGFEPLLHDPRGRMLYARVIQKL